MSAFQNTPALFRKLTATDAPWLEALHTQCFEGFQRWNVELFSTILSQPITHGLVIIIDKDPVGFILGRRIVDEGEILTLAVHTNHRRKGYASRLIETFIAEQKQQGLTKLFLDVMATHNDVINLYKKNGFEIISTRSNYYQMPEGSDKKFIDAYVMQKNI